MGQGPSNPYNAQVAGNVGLSPRDQVAANPYNAQCVLDQCLDQVVGNVDLNPSDQVAACNSLFGTPVVVAS